MYHVIDLHLTSEIINSPYYQVEDSLRIQLDMCEKGINDALIKGIHELWVIHGIGEGVLKREVHKILKDYPHIKEFSNIYHPQFGWGATKIIF